MSKVTLVLFRTAALSLVTVMTSSGVMATPPQAIVPAAMPAVADVVPLEVFNPAETQIKSRDSDRGKQQLDIKTILFNAYLSKLDATESSQARAQLTAEMKNVMSRMASPDAVDKTLNELMQRPPRLTGDWIPSGEQKPGDAYLTLAERYAPAPSFDSQRNPIPLTQSEQADTMTRTQNVLAKIAILGSKSSNTSFSSPFQEVMDADRVALKWKALGDSRKQAKNSFFKGALLVRQGGQAVWVNTVGTAEARWKSTFRAGLVVGVTGLAGAAAGVAVLSHGGAVPIAAIAASALVGKGVTVGSLVALDPAHAKKQKNAPAVIEALGQTAQELKTRASEMRARQHSSERR